MDVNPTAVVFLQSLIFLLQPPNPAPAGPPAPATRAGLTAPTTPTAGQGIPLLTHTPCYSVATAASRRSRTGEPSYSSPRGPPLPRLPRLRVVPFLGLAVVHRRGALGAAWSMWSRKDFHRTWTVHGETDSWSTTAARKCLLITRKIIIPPPDSGDLPDGPLYYAKKTFPPDCWDPPATSSHARKCFHITKKNDSPP